MPGQELGLAKVLGPADLVHRPLLGGRLPGFVSLGDPGEIVLGGARITSLLAASLPKEVILGHVASYRNERCRNDQNVDS